MQHSIVVLLLVAVVAAVLGFGQVPSQLLPTGGFAIFLDQFLIVIFVATIFVSLLHGAGAFPFVYTPMFFG